MDSDSPVEASSFSEMDSKPNVELTLNVHQSVRVENKRKGFHRNNNDDTSNSMVSKPKKRIRIETSTSATDPLGFHDEGLDNQPTLRSNDDGKKKTEFMDEDEDGADLFLSSIDDINRRNGGAEEEENDSDSNNSDKFYSKIKSMEEKVAEESVTKEISETDFKEFGNSERGLVGSGSRNQSTSSSDLHDATHQAKEYQPVHVFVKIINPITNQVVIETKNFKSDMDTMLTFLKNHDVNISSSQSSYFADVSAEVTEDDSGKRRQAKSSLGSTILRPSDASSISRPSVSSEMILAKPKIPPGRGSGRPNRNEEPLLSSTRITYHAEESDTQGYSSSYQSSQSENTRNRRRNLLQQQQAVKAHIHANAREDSTDGSSSSFGTSISTEEASGSVVVKTEPSEGGRRRKIKIEHQKNGIASLASVDEFKHPGFIKSATLWGSIGPDEAVFARWRDRSYYSGKIVKRGLTDTWYIHFEDDMEDVASEAHILPIKIIGVGTWTVYSPSEEFKPEDAIVVGQRFLDNTDDDLEKIEYAIVSDEDGRVIFCCRKNLTLVENDAKDMRKQYQVQITPKAADLSLDNIISGKRNRCYPGAEATDSGNYGSSLIRKLVAEIDSSSKSPSADIASISSKRGSNNTPNTTPTTSRKPLKLPSKTLSTKLSSMSSGAVLDIPVNDAPTPEHSLKLSFDSELTMAKEDETDDRDQLFEGMEFFLTASGGVGPSPNSSLPYDKDEYRRLIETKGGTVVDSVGDEARNRQNVFLISDNYARTVKYIYALAAGIPCLSYNWITKCINEQRIVDYKAFELSSGFSIESKLVTPAHRERPLEGFRVYVTGASDELYKYWKPVLIAAGADPKRHNAKSKGQLVPDPNLTDVLVTDTTCPQEILDYANREKIPAVKPEWLVQTIITGKKVAFDGHDKYLVDELDAPPY